MKQLLLLLFNPKLYRKIEMIAMKDCAYLLAPLDPIGYDIKRQCSLNDIKITKNLQDIHAKLLKKSLSNWASDVSTANRLLKGRVNNPAPPQTEWKMLPTL